VTARLAPVGRIALKARQAGFFPKPRHAVVKRFSTRTRAEAEPPSGEPASESKPSSVQMVDTSARDARRAARDARRAVHQAEQSPAESTVASRVKMVQIEDKESLTGVTAIDRGEASDDELLGRALLLAAVDIALLVVFAATGRNQHGTDVLSAELLATAAPFIAGWLAAAPVTGVYSPQACTNEVGKAAFAAVKNWAVGIPLALILRSIFKGYMAPKSFIIVSMVVTGVLLTGWRAGAAALIPAPDGSSSKGNRKGGPLEFLKLLFGLSTRW